jgi:anti-sigma-K factor RskA
MTAMNDSERQEIEQLLPWHAAGTLSRNDAQRVEAALASDAELARRYALVREELGHTIQLNETLGAPSARVLDQLFAKIDAEPARRGSAAPSGFRDRISDFFATMSPRALSFAAAAAVIVILLQAGFIASVLVKNPVPGTFETASMGTTKAEGAYALIRFQPQASAADITTFLDANKLSVTSGPISGGLYKVKLAPAALPKDELADRIKKLQGDKVVGFIAASE